MGRLFGTDGVRGLANTELSPELAFRLGRAGAAVLTRECKDAPRVLIATDGRRSGEMLAAALGAGLMSTGATVLSAGVVPTPAVAQLVRFYGLDAGVMISASHNLMPDNGIKFFDSRGFKLPDALEDEIEKIIALLENGNDTLMRPTGAGVGTAGSCETATADYLEILNHSVPELDLSGMKIALDCANGATSSVAPAIFARLGAEVLAINTEPNGLNINENCGSTHMEALQAYVRETGAAVGLAFDGDGDRMLAVCENGEVVDGDQIMAILAKHMVGQGKLNENTLVATIMSNLGLSQFCKNEGIKLVRSAVGDRYVLEEMVKGGFSLGGEQSGHIIFKAHGTTGDGTLTGLMLLSVMAATGAPLSQLAAAMTCFPQVLVNARVPNARKAELFTHPEIIKVQGVIEAAMHGDGRILVRPSGTEPVVRVMIEGKDSAQIAAWARTLADCIEANLP